MTPMDHAREVMRLWNGKNTPSNRVASMYAATVLGMKIPRMDNIFRDENDEQVSPLYYSLAIDLLAIRGNNDDPLTQLILLTKLFEERMGGQLS